MQMMQMEFPSLLVKQEGSVLVVAINRPESLNALNTEVMTSLEKLIEGLELEIKDFSRTTIRALVITGSGEKAFVAGADIKGFENMPATTAVDFANKGQGVFNRLESLTIPVIAAVNGFALGGGLELALACDFIYASENAKFGLPECTLGLMPGYGGTVRLPRRIGPARAREMTFTGAMISAPEALTLGLANRVLPSADLLKAALQTAELIATRAPIAVGLIKKSIHEGMSVAEENANRIEAALFGELFATDDKREGVKAFMEKRKPLFKGQ